MTLDVHRCDDIPVNLSLLLISVVTMTITKKSRISPFLKQCFVTGAICSNVVGHGCMMGFPAVLLPQLLQPDSSIPLTRTAESWIASVMSIALLGSNFITPPIMERLGRKTAHYCVTVPGIAGWLTIVMAESVPVLIIGRVLQGVSVGMLLPLRSVLVGEFTSPKNRGAFLTTLSLAQAFGIFFVHLVGSLLTWQMTALISISFSFASLMMTIYSPESPSWLASKGHYEECKEIFRWLRGDEEEEELDEMIQARMLMEKYNIGEGKGSNCSEFIKVLGKREFTRPILIMFCFYTMMHLSGGTLMAAYSTKIISAIAGPGVNSHFWMIALDSLRIVANFFAIFVINKTSRRAMTFATCGLCSVSLVAIAAYLYAREHGFLHYEGAGLPLLLINIQYFCVATGVVPLPGVIAGEIFPIEYKGIGGGISLTYAAAFMFMILKLFPGMVDWIGMDGAHLTFAGGLAICLIIVGAILPETKGKTLNEIEDELRGRTLKPDEIEVRQSLQNNPVLSYRRKMSTISTATLC